MTDSTSAVSLARARLWPRLGLGSVLAAVLIVTIGLAVSVGAVAVPLSSVAATVLDRAIPGVISHDVSAGHASIIWQIRLPRVLLAGMVVPVWASSVRLCRR